MRADMLDHWFFVPCRYCSCPSMTRQSPSTTTPTLSAALSPSAPTWPAAGASQLPLTQPRCFLLPAICSLRALYQRAEMAGTSLESMHWLMTYVMELACHKDAHRCLHELSRPGQTALLHTSASCHLADISCTCIHQPRVMTGAGW